MLLYSWKEFIDSVVVLCAALVRRGTEENGGGRRWRRFEFCIETRSPDQDSKDKVGHFIVV